MSDALRLSVCMITKNEEGNLKRCLDSFLPILHEPWCELVIVDTGSTDRTVEVARQYTEHVHERRFEPWDFSAARNYGIAFARGRRVAIVDADELLMQDSLYRFEDALLNPENDDKNTFFIKLHNICTRGGDFAPVVQPRVFTNQDGWRFKPEFLVEDAGREPGAIVDTTQVDMTCGTPLYCFPVHNRPEASPPYAFMPSIVWNHYGYLFERPELFELKISRSLPMLEAEHAKAPEDLHVLTHLIKTYYTCRRQDKVLEHAEHWIALMAASPYNQGWAAFLEGFVQIVHCHVLAGDLEAAERVREESLKYSKKLISIQFILGQAYQMAGRKAEAKELFEEGLWLYAEPQTPWDMLCLSNVEMALPDLLNGLATIEFEDGNYARAGELLNQGIKLDRGRHALRWDIWNHSLSQGRLVPEPVRRKRAA